MAVGKKDYSRLIVKWFNRIVSLPPGQITIKIELLVEPFMGSPLHSSPSPYLFPVCYRTSEAMPQVQEAIMMATLSTAPGGLVTTLASSPHPNLLLLEGFLTIKKELDAELFRISCTYREPR